MYRSYQTSLWSIKCLTDLAGDDSYLEIPHNLCKCYWQNTFPSIKKIKNNLYIYIIDHDSYPTINQHRLEHLQFADHFPWVWPWVFHIFLYVYPQWLFERWRHKPAMNFSSFMFCLGDKHLCFMANLWYPAIYFWERISG